MKVCFRAWNLQNFERIFKKYILYQDFFYSPFINPNSSPSIEKKLFMVPEHGEVDNNLLSYRQPVIDRSRILSGLWIVLWCTITIALKGSGRREKNWDPESWGTFPDITQLRNIKVDLQHIFHKIQSTYNKSAYFPHFYLAKMSFISLNVKFSEKIFQEHPRLEFWIQGTWIALCGAREWNHIEHGRCWYFKTWYMSIGLSLWNKRYPGNNKKRNLGSCVYVSISASIWRLFL